MEKTTNISRIADRIMRHPLMQDISFETILDYTLDFIQIVGCPQFFEEKTAILEVNKYRALLPCDFVSMIQVRVNDPRYNNIHDSYRYSTDSFHFSETKNTVGINGTDLNYKIQGDIIYTSTENINIEIAYNAIAVDKDGFPLLPDNSSFLRALELYIKKQWFTILFDLGRINANILNQTLQDYSWAVGDCQVEFTRLSLDKAESLFNSWNALIIRAREHNKGFLNNGTKEFKKVH